MSYSNVEYFNMLMCLGRCHCNYAESRRLYEELFAIPRSIALPSTMAFQRLHLRMYNTGSVHSGDRYRADAGRQRSLNADIEEQILDLFEEDHTRSTRSVGRHLGVNHMRVWRVLKDDGQHPFHYRRVQSLLPADFEPRMAFSRWILDKVDEDSEFLSRVLFTDECSFVRTGVFNVHNEHVWSTVNPHAMKPSHFQHRWRINVWAGIIGDKIIGPCFLEQSMNGGNYLRFLQEELSEELDELSLDLVRRMWFQHDGAPPHFSLAVRNYLNTEYGERWIGRGGPLNWPARSPDLTPLDYFLWGTIKQSVFKNTCDSEAEMRLRIVAAFDQVKSDTSILQRIRANMIRRCSKCIELQGGHIEQQLHDRQVDVIIS